VGTAVTAAIGVLVFGEILTLKHFFGIACIIAGVVVMNF
jgi:multidrug transporter EmrE-like cation transporter